MKKKLIIAIGVVLCFVVGAWVLLFIPTDTETLRAEAASRANALKEDSAQYALLIKQAHGNLEPVEGVELELRAIDGSYYDFAAFDPDDGGGIQILAYRDTEGYFHTVYRGQDFPDCFDIERQGYMYRSYSVPLSLEPECLEIKVTIKNRSTMFAKLFTSTGDERIFPEGPGPDDQVVE
jgi:hypothetical protein